MKQSCKEKSLCPKNLASRPPASGATGGWRAGSRRAEKPGVAAHVFEKDGWEAR